MGKKDNLGLKVAVAAFLKIKMHLIWNSLNILSNILVNYL
jgi:hypothetical protein